MFSFRTTPLEDQLDKALRDGRVSVVCSQSGWYAETGKYVYDIFSERGNLGKVYLPEGEHIDFDLDELAGCSAVVVEVQDVGSRYFAYTIDVLRLMSALGTIGANAPALYVVDHLNPAGRDVEGTLPAGDSDVWTPEVAHRHGLTLGELCNLYHSENAFSYGLHIISALASVTNRTLMPWTIPPAEDVPGMFTPFVYSGGRLWTDTSITPGIGTQRPYEFIGAPFIKPSFLPSSGHSAVPASVPAPDGVLMRPCSFVPRFGMYEGERCWGYQIILTPGVHYHSLLHTVRLMRYFSETYSQFTIGEGLFTRLADPVMTEYLKGNITYDIVEEHVKLDEQRWIRKAKRFLLYDDTPCRIK